MSNATEAKPTAATKKAAAPAKKAAAKTTPKKGAVEAKTFVVQRGHLTEAVDIAGQAVGSGGSVQAFSLFRLHAANSRLTISGTDGDVAIAAKVKVDNKGAAQAFIPARYFAQIVKACDAETISLTFTTTGSDLVGDVIEVQVKSGEFEVTLIGGNGDQFRFLDMPKATTVEVDAAHLLDAIRSTTYATGTDKARPILMGVNVSSVAGKMTMVATDSWRMAHAKADIPALAAPCVIPSSALQQVLSLIGKVELTDAEGGLVDERPTVKVTLGEDAIGFESELGDTLVARLIEGAYPPVAKLVPEGKAIKTRATIKRADLIAAVNKVRMLVLKDHSVSLAISKTKVVVTASAEGVGNAESTVKCSGTGDNVEVHYNPDYLLDALRSFAGDDEVTLAIVSSDKPTMVIGSDVGQRFGLVMPTRPTTA